MTTRTLPRTDMRSASAHAGLSAGSLCLDFLASLEHWADDPDDRSRRPADLTGWFEANGLPIPVGGLTDADTTDADVLRVGVDTIARTVLADGVPAADVIRRLNVVATRPTPVFLLGASGRRRLAVEQADATASLSVIARDAVHLFGVLEPTRLRACAREGCDTLFYDRSASGVRRWCAMKGCGEIVASASYRRRRASRTPTAGVDAGALVATPGQPTAAAAR